MMVKNYKLKTRLASIAACCMLGLSSFAQVQVVATAGVTGPTNYTDLNSAFAAINAGTHQGVIGVGIAASTTEAGACVLNGSGVGSALYTSVTIAPTADGVTVSGPTVTGRGLVELNGADNVTIDGDNPNTAGINRNLTITNTAAATITFTSVIRVATGTGNTSADNIIVKNLILNGSATARNASGNTSTSGSENTTFGVIAGNNGSTTTPTAITAVAGTMIAAATVNGFTVDNCAINQCARGIAFLGNTATSSTGVTFTNNLIGDQATTVVPSAYPFTSPATTVYVKGIYIQGATAVSVTGNSIKNILSYVGTVIAGVELNTAIGSGTVTVSNNTINGVSLNAVSNNSARGISLAAAAGTYTVAGNSITNVQNSSGSTATANRPFGLFVATSATSGLIEKNKISTVYNKNTGTLGVCAVFLNGGSNITFRNNFVSDVNQDISGGAAFSNTTWGIFGVTFNSGTGHIVYNNSINLSGSMLGTTSVTSVLTASFVIAGTGQTGMIVKNNIFANTMTGGTTSIAHVPLFLPSGATASMNLTLNNNAYYSGTDNARQGIAQVGTTAGTGFYLASNFAAGSITPATNLRAYTSTLSSAGTNDNASYASSIAAPFVSATDLHLNTASSELANVEQKGDPAAAVTSDIDGDVRPNAGTTNPDMGADEVLAPACVAANGGTISPATVSKCAGETATVTATGASSGTGISYQWMVSTTSGSGYVNVTGGAGATTTSYTTAALAPGTYYYVLQATCTAGPVTGLSTEVAVTVNALPPVTVSPTTASICQPGATAVALTAGGAATYAWLPASGLSAATGANITALPSATTTYTVTGTDANSCTATATTTITVSEIPSSVVATATPANVCSGGNSQLNVAAATTSSYTLSSITPGLITPSGATNITTWTPDADDGSNGPIALPFGFMFYGNAYNQVYVGTNGYLSFNNLAAVAAADLRTAQTFPSATAPNNTVSFCMGDLNQAAGTTSYFTTGTAPNRVFVLAFTGVPFYGTPNTGSVTGQIQLYESTNVVEIHISGINHGTSTSNASVGIENATGTVGSTPAGRAPGTWNVTTPEAYRWTPSGVGTLTYLWSPATFLSSTTIANPMANAITSTTTYTVTVANNGCSASSSVTVTAGAALTSTSSITPAAAVCEGTTVTLNSTPVGGGLPYTFLWSGPGSYTSTSQNPSFVGTPAMSGTYTITVTDNCSATSSSTVTLTVNANPTIAVTPTSALYCSPGTGISLNATGTSTGYAWLPTAGLSAATGASVTATPSTTTTYTVTGTDGNGCTASATAAITSAPAITGATATATPAAICVGSSTTLGATASAVPATLLTENFNGATNSWTTINNSTGGTVAAPDWTLRPDGYAPGGFWASVAGVTGINSNDASQFYLTNSDAQGSGSTTNVILQSPVMSTVGYATLNLSFYNFYRFNATPDSANVEVSTNGTTWTRVNSFNGTGSTTGAATAFVQTTVNLDAYVGNPTFYVRFHFRSNWGYGWAIDNVLISGTANAFTYAWTSSPAGFTSAAAAPSASPTVNTNYEVTISNAFGCSGTATTSVTVNTPPTVAANVTASTVCAGSTVTFNGSGATSYTWTGGVTDGVAFTPASTNTYTVTGTDANGCTNTATTTVTVNTLPAVGANASAPAICSGDGVIFTGSGATSYTWTGGVTDNVVFNPTTTNTYTVTGTDANGCANTAATTVTVNALPVVTASSDATGDAICSGDDVVLTGNGATSYTWSGTVSDGVAFTPSITDTYTVTGTDVNGCEGTGSITVTVNALPAVTAASDAPGNAVCDGNTVTLTGNGATSYTWTGTVTDGVAFIPAITDTYTVTGTDINGCTGTANIMITVNALPTVGGSASASEVCAGSAVTLTGSGATSYTWTGAVSDGVAFTPSATDTYTVTGTDAGGCTNTAMVTVTVNALPAVSITPFTIPVCDNSTAFALTGGSPAGGTYSGPSVTGGMFDPSAAGAGTYMIVYTVSDTNTCSNSDSTAITVDLCSGIAANNASAIQDISVYPNPANVMVTIAVNNASFTSLQISITDIQGKLIYNELDTNVSAAYNKQINVEGFAKGVYYIKLNTGTDSKVQKLVIQ